MGIATAHPPKEYDDRATQWSIATGAYRIQRSTPISISRASVLGAALFGIGWALSALCRGPAVAAPSMGALPVAVSVAVSVASVLMGMAAHHRFVPRP